jgi:excisionase family DNA binding protein
MSTDFMTTGDAAKKIGVTSQAIITAADEGRLPVAFRTAGGTRIFRREDVERFLLARDRKRLRAKR